MIYVKTNKTIYKCKSFKKQNAYYYVVNDSFHLSKSQFKAYSSNLEDLVNRYMITSGISSRSIKSPLKFGRMSRNELLRDIKNKKKRVFACIWVEQIKGIPSLVPVLEMQEDGEWKEIGGYDYEPF